MPAAQRLSLARGGARTFREGQMLVFPVTLLVVVPTAIVPRPDACRSRPALVPCRIGLALRDGLEGDLSTLGALMVASHLGHPWLALTRVGRILDAEKVLSGDSKADAHSRASAPRVRWSQVIMFMYLVVGTGQRWDLEAGMWFTFWPLPAFVSRSRPCAAAAGERRPPRSARPAAPHPARPRRSLVVPAITAGKLLLDLQMEVLPIPGGAADLGLGSLDIPRRARPCPSPHLAGVMEERFPALLEAMKRDWRWPRTGWQALFFGLIHLNIYRLALTAILGALLAALALRTRASSRPSSCTSPTTGSPCSVDAPKDPAPRTSGSPCTSTGGLVRPCAVGRDPGAPRPSSSDG